MIYKAVNNFPDVRTKRFHSPIRPSSLPQVVDCAGFTLLEVEKEPHEVTKMGLKAHSKVEKSIKETFKQKKRIYEKLPEDLAFDESFKTYMDFIYNKFQALKKKNKVCALGVECFVSAQFYIYKLGGTADFFYFEKNEEIINKLVVCDLKTGFKPQREESFRQLMFYATALIESLTQRIWENKKKKMVGWIPNIDIELKLFTRYGVKTKKIKLDDLYDFKNKVLKRLKDTGFNVGEHCASCYNFSRCKKAQDKGNEFIQDISNDKKGLKHLKNKKFLEKYLTELKKSVIDKYEKGEDTGDFEVYEKPGRKFWKKSEMKALFQ